MAVTKPSNISTSHLLTFDGCRWLLYVIALMNHSTEKMLMQEIPRIRELLELVADAHGYNARQTQAVYPEGSLPHIPKPGTFHFVEGPEGYSGTIKDGPPIDLRPGVKMTANGRFMKNGKFICKEEAYA